MECYKLVFKTSVNKYHFNLKQNKTNIQLVIEGCLNRQPDAQRRLFELRYGLVMSICMRYGKNSEEAKEMLNDTFYTVFKFIDRYDNSYPFEPWLRKLCVNCCLMYQRKYFKKEKLFPLEEKYADQQITEIKIPDASELDYMKILNKLPPACKTVINLYVIEGYKHHEIADQLNISIGTSKSNLARAKRLLYEIIEKDSKGNLILKKGQHG